MTEKIILVDKNNKQIGICEKLKAHQEGKLHRAFSIIIFSDKNQMLLQKRALSKYHSPGLWSNTCCSHPNADEVLKEAVHRRLKQEMGFDCELKEIFNFYYHKEFPEIKLYEHEIDHVFIGKHNDDPVINTSEAADFKWIDYDILLEDIKLNPDDYTYWFKLIVHRVLENIINNQSGQVIT